MTEPGLPRPPSIASLPKDPSEVKENTSQDALDKERRSGGTVPEADDKAELDNQDHEISDREAAKKTANRHLLYDLILLFCILIMLMWPWIFFGVLYAVEGVQMNNHLAKVVTDHPHSTNFFVTLIGNIACLLIDILFSFAVIRFAQEWIAVNENVTVFDVTLISALRHQTWPWGMKDIKQLLVRNRVVPVILVGICIGAFAFIPSGITSLITPVPFSKNMTLQGVELDLASTAADCRAWLDAHPISNNCDWGTHNGLHYTSCIGENQMVDVLEAGRGDILSIISNNSQSLAFSQIGGRDGLHFLGPIRGVLPIGPDGVPAFDTLKPSPFSNNETVAGMVSYNYTLEYQGLTSGVSCSYANESPISFGPVPGVDVPWVVQYNGTCDGAANVLTDVVTFVAPNANNSLGFWACQSPPAADKNPTYLIYLRGRGRSPGGYQDSIGNITCTVSPIQPAIYPVTYQSHPKIFSTTEPVANFTQVYPRLIEHVLVGLSGVVHQAQNFQANLVAESVITFGVKSFELPPDQKNPKYLELYQAMIQGILEYEATYLRLIWSTVEGRPDSCSRTVTGSVSYEVIGWNAVLDEIGFLMPMTFFLIGALVIIIMAMMKAKGEAYEYDPSSARHLLATREGETDVPEWTATVTYRRRDAFKAAFDRFRDRDEGPNTDTILENVPISLPG